MNQELMQRIVNDIANRWPNPFEGNIKENLEAINFYVAQTYDDSFVRADVDQKNRKITLHMD